MKLGVNIDHIATIRQARGTVYPELTRAVQAVEAAGADAVTLHLREDRRHIQDSDVVQIRSMLKTRMNLEMAATDEMVDTACRVQPHDCCLVPEKREELTTEGGLDVLGQFERIHQACLRLKEAGIRVSLFIEPDKTHIDKALELGAPVIELHTGTYANAGSQAESQAEFDRIVEAAVYAQAQGLIVNAGHGLDYENTRAVAAIAQINELNIGHAIVARAIFVGIAAAVREMRELMDTASA